MNSTIIRSLLTALARMGVAEICVAAGARNAPIIAALVESEGVKLWNFFEERSASFFAIGRIQADRAPVAVLTLTHGLPDLRCPQRLQRLQHLCTRWHCAAERPAK